ncbi:hypothetical protein AVEN_273317-1 [Araneus ventricosus]|uniref:Uncharacterized protein n=1 Tax=Araneus ventricosus TaxID=182803 RepID=A0A4Y2SVI6_ARAVE|nr:hypothetical protein AVEN_273317-1 [Araneus ventricosus]
MILNLYLHEDSDSLHLETSGLGVRCCNIGSEISIVDVEGKVISWGTVRFQFNSNVTNISFSQLMSKQQLTVEKSRYVPKTSNQTKPRKKLNLSKEQLNLSKKHLNLSKEQLNLSKEHLNLSKEQLNLSKEQLNLSKEQLNLSKEQLNLSKEQLMDEKDRHVPNGVLLLRCSFDIFVGIDSSRIEYCSQVSSKKEEKMAMSEDIYDETPASCSDSCNLKKALGKLYKYGAYSDIALRADKE